MVAGESNRNRLDACASRSSFVSISRSTNRTSAAAAAQTVRMTESARRLSERLARRSPETRVQFDSQRLLALWKRLQSVSPQSVLNRGFVIVRDANGTPVQRRVDLQANQPLYLEFGDGRAAARTDAD